jgi:hypothetical protein
VKPPESDARKQSTIPSVDCAARHPSNRGKFYAGREIIKRLVMDDLVPAGKVFKRVLRFIFI